MMIQDARFRFFVAGRAEPQGSKSGFGRVCNDGKIRVSMVEGRRGKSRAAFKAWRATVSHVARLAVDASEHDIMPRPLAVAVELEVYMQRPASHVNASGELSAIGRRMPRPSVRPDVDKIERAILDSCSGILYEDDAQIVDLCCRQWYADHGVPGVRVTVGVAVDR